MSFPLNPAQRAAVRHSTVPCSCWRARAAARRASSRRRSVTCSSTALTARRIAAITFTNKAAREMRERVGELLAGQRATRALGRARDLDVPRARRADHPRPTRRRSGLKPGFSILDPDDILPIVAELIPTTDRARARAAQVAFSRWKNALVDARRRAQGGEGRRGGGSGAGFRPLRRRAARVPRGRLRRPDRAADRAARHRRGSRGEMARALLAPTDRRGPGHESRAIPAHAAPGRRARRRSPRSATTTRRSTAGGARSVENLARLAQDYPGARP